MEIVCWAFLDCIIIILSTDFASKEAGTHCLQPWHRICCCQTVSYHTYETNDWYYGVPRDFGGARIGAKPWQILSWILLSKVNSATGLPVISKCLILKVMTTPLSSEHEPLRDEVTKEEEIISVDTVFYHYWIQLHSDLNMQENVAVSKIW
jgi:hypothetical protein